MPCSYYPFNQYELKDQLFKYCCIVFFLVLPPVIETQPRSISIGSGRSATFTVVASRRELTYQWFGPGGVALSDTPGKITGATTATLQIFNIQSGDAGSYQVHVSNIGGVIESDEVTLTFGK